ncbi:MAG: ATP-dependent Clp protease proteolytic subunit [Candidatus Riflebacteria bacterium]|jgi:ATP-dependent Clp protease protease subunit|nr:ATP-dependent Clp protease proteolytic subunit [Candidatus Riflebacteria bacterium]MDD3376419.1 ATP-dependent Clp protease proteolytic subunit [Candidatus Riflebacteria bacterium]
MLKVDKVRKIRLDDEDEPENEYDEKSTEVNEIVERKLLEKRQIFLWGVVDDDSARDMVSKLLYLEAMAPGEPITFFVNSPGGVISSGMAIIDTMNLITSPVTTVCMGLAASMGSLILSAGVKGKRFVFPGGKVMIHQPSVEFLYGQATDLEIQAKQIVKTKELTASILAKNCGQKKDKVLKDMDRDYWMDAQESIQYGIVDDIYKIV